MPAKSGLSGTNFNHHVLWQLFACLQTHGSHGCKQAACSLPSQCFDGTSRPCRKVLTMRFVPCHAWHRCRPCLVTVRTCKAFGDSRPESAQVCRLVNSYNSLDRALLEACIIIKLLLCTHRSRQPGSLIHRRIHYPHDLPCPHTLVRLF